MVNLYSEDPQSRAKFCKSQDGLSPVLKVSHENFVGIKGSYIRLFVYKGYFWINWISDAFQ